MKKLSIIAAVLVAITLCAGEFADLPGNWWMMIHQDKRPTMVFDESTPTLIIISKRKPTVHHDPTEEPATWTVTFADR